MSDQEREKQLRAQTMADAQLQNATILSDFTVQQAIRMSEVIVQAATERAKRMMDYELTRANIP